MARIYIPEYKHHKNPYPGNIFAAGSLIVVNIDPLELEVAGASVGAGGVDTVLVRDNLPELKKNHKLCVYNNNENQETAWQQEGPTNRFTRIDSWPIKLKMPRKKHYFKLGLARLSGHINVKTNNPLLEKSVELLSTKYWSVELPGAGLFGWSLCGACVEFVCIVCMYVLFCASVHRLCYLHLLGTRSRSKSSFIFEGSEPAAPKLWIFHIFELNKKS